MATSLGGSTIAEPSYELDGYELETVTVGANHELANGSVHFDYVTSRYKFTFRWRAITEAEKNTIRAKAEVTSTQTLVTPDAATYLVFVTPSSWKESYIEAAGGTKYYNCELQLEESA